MLPRTNQAHGAPTTEDPPMDARRSRRRQNVCRNSTSRKEIEAHGVRVFARPRLGPHGDCASPATAAHQPCRRGVEPEAAPRFRSLARIYRDTPRSGGMPSECVAIKNIFQRLKRGAPEARARARVAMLAAMRRRGGGENPEETTARSSVTGRRRSASREGKRARPRRDSKSRTMQPMRSRWRSATAKWQNDTTADRNQTWRDSAVDCTSLGRAPKSIRID